MTKFRKNTFIKWTSQDEEGTFSHTGQVVKHADGMIIFTDKHGGEMGVPEDEGKFTPTRKPKRWNVKPGTIFCEPVKGTKQPRFPGQPSKYNVLLDAMKEHRPASRKEAIALGVELAELTAAGASTYVAKANKQLKLW